MESPTPRCDVVVVGSGLLGSALAYHLARTGRCRVGVIEGDASPVQVPIRTASDLVQAARDPWDLALVRASAIDYEALSDATGSGEYRATGTVRLARTDEGERRLRRLAAALAPDGVAAHWVGPEEVRGLIPWAKLDGSRGALWSPSDASFSATDLAVEYARAAARHGADFCQGRPDLAIRRGTTGWTVAGTSPGLRTDRIVLAAGPATVHLAAGAGVALPLVAVPTSAVLLRPAPLSGTFPALHEPELGLRLGSHPPGRLLVEGRGVGAGADSGPPVRRPATLPVDRISSQLRGMAPGLSSLSVEAVRTGAAVLTPDGRPLVGRVREAPGLFVAAGFQGSGGVRAAAIARRLADALLDERWEPLGLADPRRFGPAPFRAISAKGAPVARPASAAPRVAPAIPDVGPLEYRRVATPEEVQALALPSLSDWFDPFLRLFLQDALRTGGAGEVARADGRVRGIYLVSRTEQVGSVFTRCRPVAEHYLTDRGSGGVYADRPWAPGGEPIELLAADLRDWTLRQPIRNPVRLANAEDLPRVRELLREVSGAADEAWLDTLPRPEELCFLSEVEGRVAGVSWASVVDRHARGHSLMVRPRHRGLGVGTDLLNARMLWLQGLGVTRVVSEIYEGNRASRTAAERAGMSVVGRMFHYRGGP